jgi:hypothetical protein
MNTIKVLIINPTDRTVVEEEIENSLNSFYNIIGCQYVEQVSPIDIVPDQIYVDEEGLLKNPKHYFQIGIYRIAGIGIIISHDDEGNTISCYSTKERLLKHLTWHSAQ